MAESFADHFAESAARTNALRRSHRELDHERERATRVWRSLEEEEPASPAHHPQTLTMVGLETPGVTEEDEMNTRLASEMDQLERWKKRRELSSTDGDVQAGLSPIVRDAVKEALKAEKKCASMFHVFNPPEHIGEDSFDVSPQGTPRFSFNGTVRNSFNAGVRHFTSRQALVDLDGDGY